jgi:hypothetical protein
VPIRPRDAVRAHTHITQHSITARITCVSTTTHGTARIDQLAAHRDDTPPLGAAKREALCVSEIARDERVAQRVVECAAMLV